MKQRIAAKALVVHKSKALILREASTYDDGTNAGKFHLPGGRIEPGERFFDGFRREVREETGLEVEIGRPLFVGEWFPVIRDEENQIVAVFFVCQCSSASVRLSQEHDDYLWIAPGDYGRYALMTPEDEVFQAYLDARVTS